MTTRAIQVVAHQRHGRVVTDASFMLKQLVNLSEPRIVQLRKKRTPAEQ